MALENFCDTLIKTDDLQEIRSKLDKLDQTILQSRDGNGNSLLHLIIQAECRAEIFKLILDFSNLSWRNKEFKLAQDLFPGNKFEEFYEKELVDYLVNKLCNCEGDYLRNLVIQGWDYKPFLEKAIDKLLDKLNDNFSRFVSSIECLLEAAKRFTEVVVNEDDDKVCGVFDLIKSSPYKLLDIISMRNQCGLTLCHIAIVFERYNLMGCLVDICEEKQVKITDHLGRTVLHYLYPVKPLPISDEIFNKMLKNPYFDCLDHFGNPPEYYELFSESLQVEYCREFVKSDLINFKMINRKGHDHVVKKEMDNESSYLKETVGKALVKAFALVVEKRPCDPIDFLGNFLKFYATNFDHSDYEYEELSSKIDFELTPNKECKFSEKIFTFNPEMFSPFAKVARDTHGTPLGYKLLIKKLKSFDSSEIDWFEIIKRGLNFALRDSNENTLIEIATSMDFNNIKNDLDIVILNMINEENLLALKNLYTCGFYDNLPDIYDLCGPDLFDVSQEVADFYTSLKEEQENIKKIFSTVDENSEGELNWSCLIKSEMTAYAYNRKGMSVIHWAIASNNHSLFHYLVDYFPECLKLKDCFNRNVYHYSVAFSNKQFYDIITEYYLEGKEELDCFDYLPEYYEHYQSAFRNLM